MAATFSRFDTTPQNLIAAIKAAVLASSDWADISVTDGPSTTQSASAVNATSVTVASSAAFAVGMTVVFEPGTAREEYRNIATIPNATSITVANLTYAHGAGSVVRYASHLLKATTTRGAQMVVDLADGPLTLMNLGVGFFRTHNGVYNGGSEKLSGRYLPWRTTVTGASWTMPLHVTVSASKEHLFVQVEGPRPHEAGAFNTTWGSAKTYFFMADLVPYHAADTTPAVVVGAGAVSTGASSLNGQSHICYVSRNAANNASWTPGRLATLDFPAVQSPDTIAYQRQCAIDGNRYVFPYVYFDEVEGIRGRLDKIFYAGDNAPAAPGDQPVTSGEMITYGGAQYRLTTANQGDGSTNSFYGALGAAVNSSTASFRSVVVAVPAP